MIEYTRSFDIGIIYIKEGGDLCGRNCLNLLKGRCYFQICRKGDKYEKIKKKFTF